MQRSVGAAPSTARGMDPVGYPGMGQRSSWRYLPPLPLWGDNSFANSWGRPGPTKADPSRPPLNSPARRRTRSSQTLDPVRFIPSNGLPSAVVDMSEVMGQVHALQRSMTLA